MIRIEDLERIINIVENHELSHFEFEQDNSRVIIDKMENNISNYSYNTNILSKDKDDCYEESHANSTPDIIHNDKTNSTEKSYKEDEKYIKSSLAGLFYLKKDECSEPFVNIGDKVEKNTIVGLIEVMKLFNEIESGKEGYISKILVKDGDFVEYGQPLFELN